MDEETSSDTVVTNDDNRQAVDEETSSDTVVTNHDNRQAVDEETSSESVELSPIMTIDRQWVRKQAVRQ